MAYNVWWAHRKYYAKTIIKCLSVRYIIFQSIVIYDWPVIKVTQKRTQLLVCWIDYHVINHPCEPPILIYLISTPTNNLVIPGLKIIVYDLQVAVKFNQFKYRFSLSFLTAYRYFLIFWLFHSDKKYFSSALDPLKVQIFLFVLQHMREAYVKDRWFITRMRISRLVNSLSK